MDADSIKIECEEDGFWLVLDGVDETTIRWDEGRAQARFHVSDPEALYDHVKAVIGPWLYERSQAENAFRMGETEVDAYPAADPKHPAFHSVHADIWDGREGK